MAYRLNGQDLPLKRGDPVRMVVPWAHGFKSIKWLQKIVLTNEYQANDTYTLQNNDPESHLKTAAYLGKSLLSFKEIWGLDPKAGRPEDWPVHFSMLPWTARLEDLAPGSYEIRARTVDLNGFSQPEPRLYQKLGMNLVPCRNLTVTTSPQLLFPIQSDRSKSP